MARKKSWDSEDSVADDEATPAESEPAAAETEWNAAAALKAFEDEIVGADCARTPDGKVLETGHGSVLSRLPQAAKDLYAALTACAEAETGAGTLYTAYVEATARVAAAREKVTAAQAAWDEAKAKLAEAKPEGAPVEA